MTGHETSDDDKDVHPPQTRGSQQQSIRLTTIDSEATKHRSIRSIALVMLCVMLTQIYLISHFSNDTDESGCASMSSISRRTHVAEPILIMGLPNSGSLALHRYFQCRGMTSRHYCCGGDGSDAATAFPCPASSKTCGECVLNNMKERRLPFEGCHSSPMGVQVWSSFDVETQDEWFLPQHFAIGLLHEAYPNATWILNKRSSSQLWAESILHWQSKTRRIFASYHLPLYPHPIPPPPNPGDKVSHDEIVQDMERVLQERIYNLTEHHRKLALLSRLYLNHSRTIRLWAQQYTQQHQLLEINVDDSPSSILQALDEMFGGIDSDGNLPAINSVTRTGEDPSNNALEDNNSNRCAWKYEPPDNDWKIFELPF